jgi:hypothetical protein
LILRNVFEGRGPESGKSRFRRGKRKKPAKAGLLVAFEDRLFQRLP